MIGFNSKIGRPRIVHVIETVVSQEICGSYIAVIVTSSHNILLCFWYIFQSRILSTKKACSNLILKTLRNGCTTKIKHTKGVHMALTTSHKRHRDFQVRSCISTGKCLFHNIKLFYFFLLSLMIALQKL